ncbi:hypothetical protein JZO80_00100 [Vagococcus fluvialis]|uniref:hypothetical protein n=1 Tax=Vagococcus fluvialis TaxID=2738 RepID=UPI000A334AF6|nr:hypothetical protein [Vagococcus fluvialis]MBO0418541.1 hypothetical protein [Vagococcus fluvialis]OTP31492.1 hypothetical protein A5798_001514 [Enterococcus sp. 6C8_DIV0013]
MESYGNQTKKLLHYVEKKLLGEILIENLNSQQKKNYPLAIFFVNLAATLFAWFFPIFITPPLTSYKLSIFSEATEKSQLFIPYFILLFILILHISLYIYQRKEGINFKGKTNSLAISAVLLLFLFKSKFRFVAAILFFLSALSYFLFYLTLNKKASKLI